MDNFLIKPSYYHVLTSVNHKDGPLLCKNNDPSRNLRQKTFKGRIKIIFSWKPLNISPPDSMLLPLITNPLVPIHSIWQKFSHCKYHRGKPNQECCHLVAKSICIYLVKGTISNHADWFSHWISTFESLTPQILWPKKETFRIHRNAILVSLYQEFLTLKFLYLHFYSF